MTFGPHSSRIETTTWSIDHIFPPCFLPFSFSAESSSPRPYQYHYSLGLPEKNILLLLSLVLPNGQDICAITNYNYFLTFSLYLFLTERRLSFSLCNSRLDNFSLTERHHFLRLFTDNVDLLLPPAFYP